MDAALTEFGHSGKLIAHRLDCQEVQEAREKGRPIFTMLEFKGPLPDDVLQHSCLIHGSGGKRW